MIPKDVEQFLLKHIDSVAQWEALLLMRAHPEKMWQVPSIAQSIYASEAEAAQLLSGLVSRGIVAEQAPGVYRYRPTAPDTERLVAQGAELYAKCLIPMTNLIHSKSKARIQTFANAFKIRKD